MNKNLKLSIIIAVCILIGFGCGLSYARYENCKKLERSGPHAIFKGMRHRMHPKRMKRHFKLFASKLNLNKEQERKIKDIFDTSRKELMSIRKEIHPRFIKIKESTDAKIRDLLSAEQKKRFDEMNKKRTE